MDDAAHTFEPDQTIDLEADEAKNRRVTPLRAVRQECLDCSGGSANEVRLCIAKSCALWPFRFGRRPTDELKAEVADRVLHPAERGITGKEFHDNGGTALQAIKLKCLDCSGYNRAEVKGCTFTNCALHPLRLGKATRNYSDEVKAEMAERARAMAAKWRSLPGNDGRASDPEASA
jgi:hypothetical protein